jgi:hypothetical protein
LWLLCGISHVFAKQLAVHGRLSRHAKTIQKLCCDASLERRFLWGEQIALSLVDKRRRGHATAAKQINLLTSNRGW